MERITKMDKREQKKAKKASVALEHDDDDDSDSCQRNPFSTSGAKRSIFELLDVEEPDNDDDEEQEKILMRKASTGDDPERESLIKMQPVKVFEKKQNKKKGDKKIEEQEDIDAILAELSMGTKANERKKNHKIKGQNEIETEENLAEVMAIAEQENRNVDDVSTQPKPSMMRKEAVKAKKQTNPDGRSDENVSGLDKPYVDGEDEDENQGSTVKTAAQKRKEKKERQKIDKQKAVSTVDTSQRGFINEDIAKALSRSSVKGDKQATTTVGSLDTMRKSTDLQSDAMTASSISYCEAPTAADGFSKERNNSADDNVGEEISEDGKSKKLKKERERDRNKKKVDKEKEEKKPSKMVKEIQERLKLIKQEEERQQREEEEKMRKAEEAERAQKEKERLERERKEREEISEDGK